MTYCSGVYKPPQTGRRAQGASTASCILSIFKTGLILARGNALNLGTMKPMLQTEGGGGEVAQTIGQITLLASLLYDFVSLLKTESLDKGF